LALTEEKLDTWYQFDMISAAQKKRLGLYKTYKTYLQERFPQHKIVRKVSLNGGFTCPNLDGTRGLGGCTYCNNDSFSPSLETGLEKVREQLAEGMKRLGYRYPGAAFMAYFQPYTNTYATAEELRPLYEEILAHPNVVGLSVGTRPDCLPEENLNLLKEVAQRLPVILEIGLQTAVDRSLKRTNRGHTALEFVQAALRSQRMPQDIPQKIPQGISHMDLGTHVILGLPGETAEDFRSTARIIAFSGLDIVKIHPLHIVKNTVMAGQFSRGEISLLSLDQYIQAAADFIEYLPPAMAVERFTGEAPDALHLAPEWSDRRDEILAGTGDELLRRGTRQGSRSFLNFKSQREHLHSLVSGEYKQEGFVKKSPEELDEQYQHSETVLQELQSTWRESEFLVRAAHVNDVSAISEIALCNLHEQIAPSHSDAEIQNIAPTLTAESFAQQLQWKTILVAEHQNKIIGTAALANFSEDKTKPWWNVSNCFVDQNFQGLGVGQHLISMLESVARQKKVTTLSVPSSRNGKGFYEKLGFSEDHPQGRSLSKQVLHTHHNSQVDSAVKI